MPALVAADPYFTRDRATTVVATDSLQSRCTVCLVRYVPGAIVYLGATGHAHAGDCASHLEEAA